MCTLKLPAAELRRGEEVPNGPEPMRANVGLLVSGVPHNRRASPAGIALHEGGQQNTSPPGHDEPAKRR